MIRVVAALSVVLGALALAGCGGGGSKDSAKDTAATDKTPVTLTFWSPFTNRELKVMNAGLAKFHKKYPWITVKSVGAITADKLTAAIHAGNPPDVASMFETDNLGAFCNSGAWQDLNHYIDADKFDMQQYITRCYGSLTTFNILFKNKDDQFRTSAQGGTVGRPNA